MASDHSVSLHVPRFAVWLLAFLIIAPWIGIGLWLGLRPNPVVASAPAATFSESRTTSAKAPTSDLQTAHPGPWGDVEYYPIMVEPPEEFILADYTRPEVKPWIFKGYTDASLAALWQTAGLDAAQLAFVNDAAHLEHRAGAIVVHADANFIVRMTQTQRTKIYTTLAEFPENFDQATPFRLRAAMASEWLEGTDLPAEAVALTKKLLYPRGVALCFSDDDVVMPTIPPAQRPKYIKALSRKSALVITLRVSHGEDVGPLVNYWGRGGRSKDLNPLLQSLARRPHGGFIDIVHLLPRFARTLVYTYPLPSDKPVDANHDCHWTSFNFQNDTPDERFSNIDYVRQVLTEQYYPVPGAPQLGDILMFVRPDGVVVHSCVYIADDIVFTKNGAAYSVPWLLTPLADVQAFYSTTSGLEIRRYRAKNL